MQSIGKLDLTRFTGGPRRSGAICQISVVSIFDKAYEKSDALLFCRHVGNSITPHANLIYLKVVVTNDFILRSVVSGEKD